MHYASTVRIVGNHANFSNAVSSAKLLYSNVFVGILILITHIDTEKDLYCTSEVVTETLSDPSAFCWISGRLEFFMILMIFITCRSITTFCCDVDGILVAFTCVSYLLQFTISTEITYFQRQEESKDSTF